MKKSEEIIEILHSIKDVRLDRNSEIEVKFDEPSTSFTDGFEPNAGYIHNSFTEQLLLLIEAELKGELSEN